VITNVPSIRDGFFKVNIPFDGLGAIENKTSSFSSRLTLVT